MLFFSESLLCQPSETEQKCPRESTTVRFEDMIVDVINSTTLHVEWCSVVDCVSLSGYKIRYSLKESSSYNEIFVTPGISSYTISGLKPNTEYIINVNAVDVSERVVRNCGWGTFRTEEADGMSLISKQW